MLTLALTGTVPETDDPDAGELILTIRLPSCAGASGEKARLDTTNNNAAPSRIPILMAAPSCISRTLNTAPLLRAHDCAAGRSNYRGYGREDVRQRSMSIRS